MGYNITIEIRKADDLKRITHFIAELVENATGQRCQIVVSDKHKKIQQTKHELFVRQEKLMYGGNKK